MKGPALKGSGLGRQLGGLVVGQLAIEGQEVTEEYTQGDAVDDKVMEDEQQACRLVMAKVEEGDVEEGRGRDVDAGLELSNSI